MVITVQLSPEVEEQLRAAVARGDLAAFGRLLVDTVGPEVRSQLQEPESPQLSVEEMDRLFDEIDAEMDAHFGGNVPVLPDEAITREGIYGDHP